MRTYLVGHAGARKTSRLTARLVALIEGGTRPDRILCLLPQRNAITRANAALATARTSTRGQPFVTTLGGLAQQHVALFFPLIAASAGFAEPAREPVFINVEAAQYFVNQLLEAHMPAFEDLKLFRARIVSQALDNLNKAATSGFGLDQIAARLASAWPGESRRLLAYRAVEETAREFREFCLRQGLLDFSLTLDLFGRHLLNAQSYRDYAAARFRHVLIDNVEEGAPPLHDLAAFLLTTCDSALIVEDDPGGYRLFLGADVASARRLRALCVVEVVDDTRATGPARLAQALDAALAVAAPDAPAAAERAPEQAAAAVTVLETPKYWTVMVQGVVERIRDLVAEGVPAAQIAVIAPFVQDVLRFELQERLRSHQIALTSLRPSRPLFDHPVTRALVAFARLAHPDWDSAPTAAELARALSVAIDDLDIVRAQLLADQAARIGLRNGLPDLTDAALWTRVGMRFRERYVTLQHWLAEWARRRMTDFGAAQPLDLFWQLLFTEVLSQPGFGLSSDRDSASTGDRLIRSARAFREVFEQRELRPGTIRHAALLPLAPAQGAPRIVSDDIGLAYTTTLSEGMLAAQFVRESSVEDGVLLAPVYAYLTNDCRSRVQFWLDVQSGGWHERIYQPLTHPYVLMRAWSRDDKWTDADEVREARSMLRRVVTGLAYRCDERVVLASSQLSISGQEESGMLARALQRVVRNER